MFAHYTHAFVLIHFTYTVLHNVVRKFGTFFRATRYIRRLIIILVNNTTILSLNNSCIKAIYTIH